MNLKIDDDILKKLIDAVVSSESKLRTYLRGTADSVQDPKAGRLHLLQPAQAVRATELDEVRGASELFEAMFDALPANAALVDRSGRIASVNYPWRAFARENDGIPGLTLEGSNYIEVCQRAAEEGDVDAASIHSGLSDLLSGKIDSFEKEYPCHAPGELRWFRLFARPFSQKEKQFIIVLHLDITQRKLAEFSLKKQAEILNLVHDAVLVVDMSDKITYANAAAISLYGWPKSELVGQNASQLLYKELPSDFAKKKELLLKQGRWSGEVLQTNKSGQPISVGARWSLIRDENGNESILKAHTDLTLLGQFLRAQRMQTVGSIAGGIAHDLNNLLTPILLMCDSIASDQESQHARTGEKISKLTEKASTLIRQLLGFARGFDGARTTEDLVQCISDTVGILRISIPKNINLNFETGVESAPVSCNQTQIQQVLMNLCLNARDSIREEGSISISLSQEEVPPGRKGYVGEAKPGAYNCVTVADNGSGISAQDLERIFEPFFSTKPVGQGTGLGLSTCLGIVRSHGGFIDVFSEPSRGTKFSVYLPVLKSDEFSFDAQERRGPRTGTARILVVDDEEEIRLYLSALLQQQTFEVVTVDSGDAAIVEILNAEKPFDLVVTDMNMPGMTGFELVEYLTMFQKDISLIGMSGHDIPANQLSQLETRVHAFLLKPFRANQILNEIDKALNSV